MWIVSKKKNNLLNPFCQYQTTFGGGSMTVRGDIPSLKKKRLPSLETILLQINIKMRFCNLEAVPYPHYSPRCQCVPTQSRIRHRLNSDFRSRKDEMNLPACPQPHWTLEGSSWASCSYQGDQHTHFGWLMKKLVEEWNAIPQLFVTKLVTRAAVFLYGISLHFCVPCSLNQ